MSRGGGAAASGAGLQHADFGGHSAAPTTSRATWTELPCGTLYVGGQEVPACAGCWAAVLARGVLGVQEAQSAVAREPGAARLTLSVRFSSVFLFVQLGAELRCHLPGCLFTPAPGAGRLPEVCSILRGAGKGESGQEFALDFSLQD